VTKVVTWSVVGVVVVLAAVFAGRLDLGETVPASPLIGRGAPDLDLPLLEGAGSAPVHDGEADVTVVSFWASWCPPCRAEHPDLVAAADALGPDGVRFVAIDSRDTTNAAVEFGVWGLPETFFLDETGTIVGKVAGGVDFVTVLDLVEQVRSGEAIGERSTGEVYQDR
jgi:cytochrome c biogenesis protein CcmG/thiol:disulfide interchange protein DsbE